MTIPESRCDTLQLFATGICPEGHQDDQRTDYVWLEDSNGSTPFERPSPITFELADFADSSRRTFGDYSSNPSNGSVYYSWDLIELTCPADCRTTREADQYRRTRASISPWVGFGRRQRLEYWTFQHSDLQIVHHWGRPRPDH